MFPKTRLRRLRYNSSIRNLVTPHRLNINDFVMPLFVHTGTKNLPIESMPGQYQIALANLKEELDELLALKIPAVLLFGIPDEKDATGSDAYSDDGVIQRATRLIKSHCDLAVISDLCCCEYTDHGHCGPLKQGVVDNDATLKILQRQALSHAQAGVDMVAPSGMIDGMVAAIRSALDAEGFETLPILSYSIKYASSFYGPFRAAAGGSAPSEGDRRNHQIDPSHGDFVLREVEEDIAEGADLIMVKPANMYLDVIHNVKTHFPEVPLVAYQVSGEYAMLQAAAEKSWLDLDKVSWESLIAIKRAGADIIISYFAKTLAKQLNKD